MATTNTTSVLAGATLTQKELFQRFLEAPVFEDGTKSTLVAARCATEETMQARYFGYFGFDSVCLPDELPDQMIEELRECDDPENEMDTAIGDLECLLRDLKSLKREFSLLTGATRTEEPDEDAPDKVYRDWEDNPRYVLPVPDDANGHLRDAHAAVTRLSREGAV